MFSVGTQGKLDAQSACVLPNCSPRTGVLTAAMAFNFLWQLLFCNTSPIDQTTSTWQTTFLLSPEMMATTPTHWWGHRPLGTECPVVKLSLGVRQQCTLGRRKHRQTLIPQCGTLTDFALVHGRVRKERPASVRGWPRIVHERPHSDRFPGYAAFLGALFLMLRQEVSDLNNSCFAFKKKVS